jgi:hypothetical protein
MFKFLLTASLPPFVVQTASGRQNGLVGMDFGPCHRAPGLTSLGYLGDVPWNQQTSMRN